VFCNRKAMGMEGPQVITNDFHGGLLATRHLIEQGYERIAYISHPRYTISLNRYMGYLSAHNLAGIPVDQDLTVFADSWDFEAPGRQEMGRLLDGPNPPDAVFCFTDLLAKGAYGAVVERGLVPGWNVGIVGYDDSTVCQMTDIPMSSVKLHSLDLGRRSAEMLFDFMEGRGAARNSAVILNPRLKARQSSMRRG
jgi:LacI family transcriptional regulator